MVEADIEPIVIKVLGEPVPQGSTKAFITKSGKPIITHSNKNLKQWRQRIATEGQKGRPTRWDMDQAILLGIDFLMPRPKSLPKKVKEDVKRPDLDKLVRAVLDGLTGIYFNDDSQVVQIFAGKRYVEKYEAPGANITIIPTPIRDREAD
ncbi:MAG: RusA family crossover junction endodeoxyribonuclease [Thermoplasmata archaeon]|nr:RusA family crossover junction endodeoxyribonuclease [Thermoplasmata archaeon]